MLLLSFGLSLVKIIIDRTSQPLLQSSTNAKSRPYHHEWDALHVFLVRQEKSPLTTPPLSRTGK